MLICIRAKVQSPSKIKQQIIIYGSLLPPFDGPKTLQKSQKDGGWRWLETILRGILQERRTYRSRLLIADDADDDEDDFPNESNIIAWPRSFPKQKSRPELTDTDLRVTIVVVKH